MTAAAVNPEKILRDLRELWAELGKEQESSGGVLRACAMTLIAIAEHGEDSEAVRKTIGVLMHDHPSRAIVLQATEGAPLEGRVFAECWMPFGRNQQICAEGIELTADLSNLGEVAQLLVPLLVPDLPVVLWCRGPQFFSSRYFDPLFPLADRIVCDSGAAPNAKGAIAVLRELRSRVNRLADLSWTRLTAWREALSNAFESGAMDAGKVRTARIQYGGAPSTAMLYLSRWIERAIPAVRVTAEAAAGSAGLRSVTLSGDGIDVSVVAADASLEVRTGSSVSRLLLPPCGEDALMREELSIVERDPAFEAVLR